MIIAVKCPSCSASLNVPDDVEFVICEFCSCTVKVRDIVRIETDYDVPEWMKIADNAYKGKNYSEAYEYYNMVLEKESFREKAWIGKGLSAGRLSEAGELKFDEMIQLVKYGLEITNEKNREEEKSAAKKEMLTIFQDYFSQAKKDKFSDKYYFDEYIKENMPLAEACEKAHSEFFSRDIIFIKFYCLVLTNFLQKNYEYNAESRTVIELDEPQKANYKNKLKELENGLKSLDRNYTTYEETQRKKAVKKIIVTSAAVIFTGLIVLFAFNYFKSVADEKKAMSDSRENTIPDKPVQEYELLNKSVKNKKIIYTVFTETESLSNIQKYAGELIKSDENRAVVFVVNFFSDNNAAVENAGKEIPLTKNEKTSHASFSAAVKYAKGNKQKEIYYYQNSKLVTEKF